MNKEQLEISSIQKFDIIMEHFYCFHGKDSEIDKNFNRDKGKNKELFKQLDKQHSFDARDTFKRD